MTSLEEIHIIKRAQSGDKRAFEALVIDSQKKVYNLALKMTKNEQDALDISQEAFIKAYSNIDKFRLDSRFSVWMYRLTYNLCIDFLRSKKKEHAISLVDVDDSGEEVYFEIPDERYLPETEAERKELRRAVDEGMSALKPHYRQILIMREITGMAYEQIADTLGINAGTVKSRIARARALLAGLLIKNGTFSPENRHNNDETEVTRHD